MIICEVKFFCVFYGQKFWAYTEVRKESYDLTN